MKRLYGDTSLEQYIDMMEAKREELTAAYMTATMEAERDGLSGWHIELRLWADGSIDTSELLSVNSWTEGDFRTVAAIDTWDAMAGYCLTDELQHHERYGAIKAVYMAEEGIDADELPQFMGDFGDYVERSFPGIADELRAGYRKAVLDEAASDMQYRAADAVDRAIEEARRMLDL